VRFCIVPYFTGRKRALNELSQWVGPVNLRWNLLKFRRT